MSDEKVIELAKIASSYLVSDRRVNGDTFVKFSDARPEWCQELARYAHDHGEILPDDWRYEFIDRALTRISDADSDDNLDDLADDIEGDITVPVLIDWLSSNYNRLGYCDEYLGEFSTLEETIRFGQASEIREVFGLVLEFLRDLADEMDDEEEVADDE